MKQIYERIRQMFDIEITDALRRQDLEKILRVCLWFAGEVEDIVNFLDKQNVELLEYIESQTKKPKGGSI